jgi:hypothetical protein
MFTQCPTCKDQTIVQRERAPGLFVWVIDNWINPDDGLEVEIDYCPFCGTTLQDSDECGELPPIPINIEQIEQALTCCTHPYTSNDWCHQCGIKMCVTHKGWEKC